MIVKIVDKLDKSIYFFLTLFALLNAVSQIGAKNVLYISEILAVVRFAVKPIPLNIDKKFLVLVVLFLSTLLASCIFSVHSAVSFHAIIVYFDQYFGFFLVTALFIRKSKQLHVILFMFGVSFLISDIYAIVEWFRGVDRPGVVNYVREYMTFAAYLEQIIPLFIVIALEDNTLGKWMKYFMLFISLLSVAALVVNETRGAWIAVGFVTFFYMLIIYRRTAKINYKIIAICLLLVLLVVTVPSLQQRLSSIPNLNYESNSERLLIWKEAWHICLDHPLTGVGLGNYAEVSQVHYVSPEAKERWAHIHAHNDFLHFSAEAGIPGFIAFAALFAYIIHITWKASVKRDLKGWPLAVMLVTISLQIQGLTEYTYFHIWSIRLYWFILGLFFAAKNIYNGDS